MGWRFILKNLPGGHIPGTSMKPSADAAIYCEEVRDGNI
jgi:hypothetical protein